MTSNNECWGKGTNKCPKREVRECSGIFYIDMQTFHSFLSVINKLAAHSEEIVLLYLSGVGNLALEMSGFKSGSNWIQTSWIWIQEKRGGFGFGFGFKKNGGFGLRFEVPGFAHNCV